MKSGIVTFGESKRVHSEAMKERTWVLGGESVAEFMSIKTLVLLKTILGHSPPMLMIISIKLEKKPVCYSPRTLTGGRSTPLTYIKFWRQACLPTLLYGT